MKLVHAIVLSAIFPFAAAAHEGKPDPANFEKNKAEKVAEIEERIQKMQQHKACVSAAADHEALKKCREAMKDWHHDQRMEHMEKRKDRMEKHKEHLERRIKNMEEKKN